MAAWRGGRKRTWITGAVTFLVAIPCALTGYVSQQNFDSQWISTQAKDAMNATGIGAFFNLLDFGQMYSYHIFLLPVAVVALVAAHVLLVRKHGIVPPFTLDQHKPIVGAAAAADGAAAAPAAGAETEGSAADEAAGAPDGQPQPAPEPQSSPRGEAEPAG
jgi:ubiquinol-cytochrome c reductase cytochrome b subunit